MPREVRDFWLPRFRNFKVKFLFSASQAQGCEVRTHTKTVVTKKKKKRVQQVEGTLVVGVVLCYAVLSCAV